jgi:hypothetical protein
MTDDDGSVVGQSRLGVFTDRRLGSAYGSCGNDFGKETRNVVVYRLSSESFCTVRPQAILRTGTPIFLYQLFDKEVRFVPFKYEPQKPVSAPKSDGWLLPRLVSYSTASSVPMWRNRRKYLGHYRLSKKSYDALRHCFKPSRSSCQHTSTLGPESPHWRSLWIHRTFASKVVYSRFGIPFKHVLDRALCLCMHVIYYTCKVVPLLS